MNRTNFLAYDCNEEFKFHFSDYFDNYVGHMFSDSKTANHVKINRR